jgi:N-acyl amino acid synthase of PEP-CTERM/exosortase system
MGVKKIISTCMETMRYQSFFDKYNDTFAVVQARTAAQKKQVFQIRYDVYCEENGLIDPKDKRRKLERDVYDENAAHALLIHRPSGRAVGTVRTIFPDENCLLQSFPLQEVCDHPFLLQKDRMETICEVSRLCMIKDFRRRERDGKILPAYYSPDDNKNENVLFRRVIPYAPLGLLQASFDAALSARVVDCISVFDFEQLHALEMIGLKYRILGPQIGYMGQRQPIVFNIKNALDNMAIKDKASWEIVSDQGRLHKKANELAHNDWSDTIFGDECHEMIVEKLSQEKVFS